MQRRIFRVLYLCIVCVVFILGIWLYESEEFDKIPPLTGEENYLVHTKPLIPREQPDLMIAEEGNLFLFYIDTELVNVYSVSGEFLYGIQFPDCQTGKSDMVYSDGLLYVDVRGSGIYVFKDTELVELQKKHRHNDEYDTLKTRFTGKEDCRDGEYLYCYIAESNRIIRLPKEGSDPVIQFPQPKFDRMAFLLAALVLIIPLPFLWNKKPSNNP